MKCHRLGLTSVRFLPLCRSHHVHSAVPSTASIDSPGSPVHVDVHPGKFAGPLSSVELDAALRWLRWRLGATGLEQQLERQAPCRIIAVAARARRSTLSSRTSRLVMRCSTSGKTPNSSSGEPARGPTRMLRRMATIISAPLGSVLNGDVDLFSCARSRSSSRPEVAPRLRCCRSCRAPVRLRCPESPAAKMSRRAVRQRVGDQHDRTVVDLTDAVAPSRRGSAEILAE